MGHMLVHFCQNKRIFEILQDGQKLLERLVKISQIESEKRQKTDILFVFGSFAYKKSLNVGRTIAFLLIVAIAIDTIRNVDILHFIYCCYLFIICNSFLINFCISNV